MTVELQLKLKSLTGPDPEVDLYVNTWLCQNVYFWTHHEVHPDIKGEGGGTVLRPPDLPPGFQYPPIGAVHFQYHVPRTPITRDVDAVISILNSLDVNFHAYTKDHQKVTARVGLVDKHGNKIVMVEAVHRKSPAIAMLMAFIKFYERRHPSVSTHQRGMTHDA